MNYLNMVYGFKYVFVFLLWDKGFDLVTAADTTVFRLKLATNSCASIQYLYFDNCYDN